jgi:hypothetical protein
MDKAKGPAKWGTKETTAIRESDTDLSPVHLQQLIETMPEWSRAFPYTRAQMAAWRLRWFGLTPEDDERARDEYDMSRRSYDDRDVDREPFNDWPNGQGVYD